MIQGIRDFEGQLVRAMKGISLACVLYSKLLLHGVHVDLERLQSKKTAAEQEALSFDKENVEERFTQTLESRVHAWLVDVVPRDIQNKASNRAHTLSARMFSGVLLHCHPRTRYYWVRNVKVYSDSNKYCHIGVRGPGQYRVIGKLPFKGLRLMRSLKTMPSQQDDKGSLLETDQSFEGSR